jgi:hypothetical protein
MSNTIYYKYMNQTMEQAMPSSAEAAELSPSVELVDSVKVKPS